MKFSLKHSVGNVRIAFRAFYRAVWHEYYPLAFVAIFFLIIFLLQWVFQYQQFYEVIIVNDIGQTIVQRLDFLFFSLTSLFRYPDDLTPIALILISFFQAATLVIWLRVRRIKIARKATLGALGAGIVGAGCVACASSLLTVLFSIFGSTLSIAFVSAIGDILLVVAVLLSAKAFIDIGVKTAGFFDE